MSMKAKYESKGKGNGKVPSLRTLLRERDLVSRIGEDNLDDVIRSLGRIGLNRLINQINEIPHSGIQNLDEIAETIANIKQEAGRIKTIDQEKNALIIVDILEWLASLPKCRTVYDLELEKTLEKLLAHAATKIRWEIRPLPEMSYYAPW